MSTTLRRGAVFAIALGLLVSISGCTRNPESWESFQLVNAERAARGLPTLALDQELVTKAQAWAETMAASGSVRHSKLSAGIGDWWNVLGENVGATSSASEMHRLFMGSTVHRNVLLDGRMTRVGTGAAYGGGRLYVVQVFAG